MESREREASRQCALVAVARLPEAYRGVLALSLGLGLGPLEMAPRLGLSPAAVKARLHRGRRALARLVRAGDGPLVSA